MNLTMLSPLSLLRRCRSLSSSSGQSFNSTLVPPRRRSLALSVHFQNPALGVTTPEILSRATCFLLRVDPITPPDDNLHSHNNDTVLGSSPGPAASGPRRAAKDLSWLEFIPPNHRPRVHCVAASHVLAPWKWPQYYPQEWLRNLKQEDCSYSLEVYDMDSAWSPSSSSAAAPEPEAKYALSPFVIHEPTGLDLAILHLKQEDTVVKHLEDALGVEFLTLRDDLHTKPFEEGDTVHFEGFEIANAANDDEEVSLDDVEDEDNRVFFPFAETGSLIYASKDRFLASTERPLPEGLCGGPVLEPSTSTCCGVIEGIVPVSHPDSRMAGAASFLPSFRIREFLDWAERHVILEEIVSPELLKRIVEIKETGELGKTHSGGSGGVMDGNGGGEIEYTGAEVDKVYDSWIQQLKESHSIEQADAILQTVEQQRERVLQILEDEGGDLDEVIARVCNESLQQQQQTTEEDNDEEETTEEDK